MQLIFLYGLSLLVSTISFQLQCNDIFKYVKMGCDTSYRRNGAIPHMSCDKIVSPYKVIDALTSSQPEEKSARLRLRIKGDSVSSAIFRAELKKELTFFYGCGAQLITPYDGQECEAEIIAEGRVASLMRFLSIWLRGLSSPMNIRKPNFQGPPLIIEVMEGNWGAYLGQLGRKFEVSAGPPPSLAEVQDGTMTEVRSMMGSDESVP